MSAHLKLRKLGVLLLITGILLPVVQTKFVQARSNIPQVIHSCITNSEYGTDCSTWRWNGLHYEIFSQEGRDSLDIMTVERFHKNLVVIYQVSTHTSSDPDMAIDPINRRKAIYKGHPNGNQIKNGVVKTRFILGGELLTFTWNAHW